MGFERLVSILQVTVAALLLQTYGNVCIHRPSLTLRLTSFPTKHVDTGIGFERLVSFLHVIPVICECIYESNVPQTKFKVSYTNVFIYRTSDNLKLKSLPAKHVDTGSGFRATLFLSFRRGLDCYRYSYMRKFIRVRFVICVSPLPTVCVPV